MVTLFQKNRLGCLGPDVCTIHISGEVRVSFAIYVKGDILAVSAERRQIPEMGWG